MQKSCSFPWVSQTGKIITSGEQSFPKFCKVDSRQWFGSAVPFYPREPSEWEKEMNRLLVTTPPGSPQCLGLLLRDREWKWAGVEAMAAGSLPQDGLRLSHIVPWGLPFSLSPGIPPALMELSVVLQRPVWSKSPSLPSHREGGLVCRLSTPLPRQSHKGSRFHLRRWLSTTARGKGHPHCTCPSFPSEF